MNRGKHPYPAFVRASETEQWKPSKSETGTAAGGFQGVTGYYACKGDYVANNKGVRVAKCPIGREYCYPSCHWRKGNRCYYRSKRGRQIAELKKKGNN